MQVTETTVAQWRQTNGHGATKIIFPFAWDSSTVSAMDNKHARKGDWPLTLSQPNNRVAQQDDERVELYSHKSNEETAPATLQ